MSNNPGLEDYLQWDVYVWGKALNLWEKVLKSRNIEGLALELGSKDGGLSLYLAKNFNLKVICTDINEATGKAKELHKKFDAGDKIKYDKADALSLNYPENTFDIVIFKSMLGSIGKNENISKQQKAIKEIYRVLKPDGVLFFAENGKASFIHELFRKIFRKWSSYWRYVTLDEMKNMLTNFETSELRTTGFISVFFTNAKMKRIVFPLDNFIEKFIPKKFRYVVYGYAVK